MLPSIKSSNSSGNRFVVSKNPGVTGFWSKKYDLQTLPVGDYYFEIEGRTKINVIPFKVTSEGTEFSNTVESIYYKPIVRQDGDLLFISKVSLFSMILFPLSIIITL